MKRFTTVCLLSLLAVATAWAQDDTEAKKAEYGKLAFADMEVIDLFLDLDLDAGQASRLMATISDADRKIEGLEKRLDQTQQAAMSDMFKVRDALLAGQTLSAADVPQWMRLKSAEASIGDQIAAIREKAYQDVLRRLTREQQARLAPETTPRAAMEDAAGERLEQERQLAQRQQGVAQTIINLMEQARATVDPKRFQQMAPAAIVQATNGMTGLPLEHPLQQQLNQFFLQRLTQIYGLSPAPYAQARNGVAAELSRATMYVIQQTLNQKDGTPVAQQAIDPERLRAAIRYDRSPTLLDEYAKNYRDPLARDRGGAAAEDGARPRGGGDTGRGGAER